MIYTTTYESPIGELFLAAEEEALIGLWIQGQKYFPVKLFSEGKGGSRMPGAAEQETFAVSAARNACEKDSAGRQCRILCQAREWLNQYFAGDRPEPGRLKLSPGLAPGVLPRGSGFRRQVWKLLLEIPYGEVLTYGELARRLARQRGLDSMSAQAVGGAVGHNPLSIIIPCHRVVGKDGSLTGYAGGLERKRWLLQWEGVLEK